MKMVVMKKKLLRSSTNNANAADEDLDDWR
jgi:hypothetical protein